MLLWVPTSDVALIDNKDKIEAVKIYSCMGFWAAADIWFNQCLCDFAEQWRTFCEAGDESQRRERRVML